MKKEFESFGILTDDISDEHIDFKKLQERVLKEANKTKNKWILGLGVAGLALGALIVKLKSDKN